MDRILILAAGAATCLVTTMILSWIIEWLDHDKWIKYTCILALSFPGLVTLLLALFCAFAAWKLYSRRNSIDLTLSLKNLSLEKKGVALWASSNYEWIGVDIIDENCKYLLLNNRSSD